MRWLGLILTLLPAVALAQSAGNLNLVGPSSDPNRPQLTPAALNAAINTSLMNKADAASGVLTNPTLTSPVFSNPATARTNLGLGGMAVQDPAAVAITGGSATGLTSINGAALYVLDSGATNQVMGFGAHVGDISASIYTTCAGGYSCSGNYWPSYNGWAGGGGTGMTGVENTCFGSASCSQMTTGHYNVAVGTSTIGHDITAINVIALGNDAVRNAQGSQAIIGIGGDAVRNGVNNYGCIGIGNQALTGNEMDATGTPASTTTCINNIAIGVQAMSSTSMTTAQKDIMVGVSAGRLITTGSDNVGMGEQTFYTCTTCSQNVGLGEKALYSLATTNDNVSIGYFSGVGTTGGSNVFVGSQAGQAANAASNSVYVGYQTGVNATGANNTLLGWKAGATTLTSGQNNIIIGAAADTLAAGTSNEINIGGLLFWTKASLAVPALSACGTGSPTVDTRGNNRSGTITAGAGALASCTMTFGGSGYSTWNHCRLTSQSVVANLAYSYTLTTLTVTGTSITSAKFDYDCDGV
jgi:hypothetical protein